MDHLNKVESQKEDQVYVVKETSEISKSRLTESQIFEINKNANIDYTIEIQDYDEEEIIKSQNQIFNLLVVNNLTKEEYRIKRRYYEFQWLFNALKVGFPGNVLPYFPVKDFEEFLKEKINFEKSRMKSLAQNLTQKQLYNFVFYINNHEIFKYSEQLKIFLIEYFEQYRLKKKNIDLQIQELNISQSNANNFMSLIERGLAWATQKSQDKQSIAETEEWREVCTNFDRWNYQLFGLIDKFEQMIKLKIEEIEWGGTESQIDSVENLRAKIVSGRQFNQLLIDDIESKILVFLYDEAKKLRQIDQQLTDRKQMNKMLSYLKKSQNNELRVGKMERKKQKFETNFITDWKRQGEACKEWMKTINMTFMEIWKDYSIKMGKIWK